MNSLAAAGKASRAPYGNATRQIFFFEIGRPDRARLSSISQHQKKTLGVTLLEREPAGAEGG